jgi:hypothetical protein
MNRDFGSYCFLACRPGLLRVTVKKLYESLNTARPRQSKVMGRFAILV